MPGFFILPAVGNLLNDPCRRIRIRPSAKGTEAQPLKKTIAVPTKNNFIFDNRVTLSFLSDY
jgi:hypothetical protein